MQKHHFKWLYDMTRRSLASQDISNEEKQQYMEKYKKNQWILFLILSKKSV